MNVKQLKERIANLHDATKVVIDGPDHSYINAQASDGYAIREADGSLGHDHHSSTELEEGQNRILVLVIG